MTTYGKIEPAFQTASILLFFFAAAFIWFSNAFFTKRRKKEVALYSLFGVEKRQIGKLLFYENIILGFGALCIGLVLGILLSKLFAMILIKLMGGTVVATLSISAKAVLQTIIVFMIIIAFTSFQSYRLIYRNSLLQLIKAEKQGEKRPKKASWIMGLIAILLIGGGYTIILQPSEADFWKNNGFKAIIGSFFLMTIGTYLFLRAFIMFILQRMSQMKRIYLKGVNLISLTHLFYRMKGNVLILSVIALLSTFTLLAMGTTFSLYYNMNKITKENSPFSVMYTIPDAEKEAEVRKLIAENGQKQVEFSETIEYLIIKPDLTEVSRLPNDSPVVLLSESTFQRLAEKMGKQPNTHFSEYEALTFNDGNLDQKSDPYTGKKVPLTNKETITIAAYEDYSLLNLGSSIFPMVVKDALYDRVKKDTISNELQIYSLKNEKTASKLDDKLRELFVVDPYIDYQLIGESILSTFYYDYHQFSQVYGLLIFISGFLGFIFLLATGSMLHYKLLTEATADQPRYSILKKIGMSKLQIKSSIAKQLFPFYIIPLLLAIAHSTILITAVSNFIGLSMTIPFAITICVYIAMYFIYFFITLSKYTYIVNK